MRCQQRNLTPVLFGCSPLLLLLLLLLFLCLCGCRSPVSGILYQSIAYIMVQHPSRCEIIFGIRRAITTVFLWPIAVNRLFWRLDEAGGSIMKKDVKESQLLNIIKRRFYSADVQIRCSDSVWSMMEPDGCSDVFLPCGWKAVLASPCTRLFTVSDSHQLAWTQMPGSIFSQ